MSDAMHIVMDETATAAAGGGNVLASRSIHRAHVETGWYLYAPACALVEADRARPGTAERLAALPGITVLDLDLPAARAVAQQSTWAAAHCQYAAQPTPDRPDGAIIATTAADRWGGEPVRVLDLFFELTGHRTRVLFNTSTWHGSCVMIPMSVRALRGR